MIYNGGEGGYYLEFPKWSKMIEIKKRNLICFICYIYQRLF